MAKRETKKTDDMAYELYTTMKKSVPDGTYMPAIFGAIEYLLADILLWTEQDAKQSKELLDFLGKDVLEIMLRNREMRNQVN